MTYVCLLTISCGGRSSDSSILRRYASSPEHGKLNFPLPSSPSENKDLSPASLIKKLEDENEKLRASTSRLQLQVSDNMMTPV